MNEKDLNSVKEIYLGKNRINRLKVKDTIKDLECRYSLYLWLTNESKDFFLIPFIYLFVRLILYVLL